MRLEKSGCTFLLLWGGLYYWNLYMLIYRVISLVLFIFLLQQAHTCRKPFTFVINAVHVWGRSAVLFCCLIYLF